VNAEISRLPLLMEEEVSDFRAQLLPALTIACLFLDALGKL